MSAPISQVVINAKAVAWLADVLERWGLSEGPDRAEFVTRELLAQGLAPVPKPFPLRNTAPTSTPEGRAAAMALFAAARADARTTDTTEGERP